MQISEGQAGFFRPACTFICTAKRPVSKAWNSRGESGIAAPCLLPAFNALRKSAFSQLLVEQLWYCGCYEMCLISPQPPFQSHSSVQGQASLGKSYKIVSSCRNGSQDSKAFPPPLRPLTTHTTFLLSSWSILQAARKHNLLGRRPAGSGRL